MTQTIWQAPTLGTDAHYRSRRVAITGHTGFNGRRLYLLAGTFGASVAGISLLSAGDPKHKLASTYGRGDTGWRGERQRERIGLETIN